jgi:citrate lyase subunit beta/citryl-CoA lyase
VTVDLGSARSWLFVPGDRGDRFEKAAGSGADVVICDLEDAVAPGAKVAARSEVASWLSRGGTACVRINAHGTPFHDDDVAAVAGLPGLLAVMMPKAEDPDALVRLSDALGPGTAVVALIETALGLHRVNDVATARGVARLSFGSIDFALDLSAEDAPLPLLFARSALVLASRVAGLPAPVDGVTTELDDLPVVAAAARAAAALGFGGKLCIHPRQVSAVHAGLAPTDEQLEHARQVLAASADGSVGRVNGQMVDVPVIARARHLLQRNEARAGAPARDTAT